jgi:hypothetical protein
VAVRRSSRNTDFIRHGSTRSPGIVRGFFATCCGMLDEAFLLRCFRMPNIAP